MDVTVAALAPAPQGVAGHLWVERVAFALETLAVAIIALAIVVAGMRTAVLVAQRRADTQSYTQFQHSIGRALLLGLEILVAADIVRTVILEPTLKSVATLGLLVVIRTFLSWSLLLEIEERWPWQARGQRAARATPPRIGDR